MLPTHHQDTARKLAAARKQTPADRYASRVAWGQKWGAILSALAAEHRRQWGEP